MGRRELKPWEERFVKEYWELSERQKKLHYMLLDWNAGKLHFTPKCPFEILYKQDLIMQDYLSILQQRAEIEDIPFELLIESDKEEEEKPAPPTLVTSQHFCYECKNFDGRTGKCRLPGTPNDPYFCGLANFWEVR